MWRLGFRYRVDAARLPGRPDVVFSRARVLVFVDGDFWHGRHLATRIRKLAAGHNAQYWVEKIRANVERDRRQNAQLRALGWVVLRFWESDIKQEAARIVTNVAAIVDRRTAR